MLFKKIKRFIFLDRENKRIFLFSKRRININYDWLAFLIFAPLSIFFIELLSRGNLKYVINFFSTDYFDYIINVLLYLNIMIFIAVIFKNKWFSGLILATFNVSLGIANQIKIDFRNVGFSLEDFYTVGEAGAMADSLSSEFLVTTVLLGIIVSILEILFLKFIFKIPKSLTGPKMRAFLLILTTAIFIGGFYLIPISATRLFQTHTVKQKEPVERIGSLYFFEANMYNNDKLKKPTKEKINETFGAELDLINKHTEETEVDPNANVIQPDIIFIQSESFWDPTVVGLEKFSRDPLPFFHSLKNNPNAQFYSLTTPAKFGGTANAEYETLTGMSVAFYPESTTYYNGFFDKPQIGIPSIARNNNYYTAAIHPFKGEFYKRNSVYKLMGFNKFSSLETLTGLQGSSLVNQYKDNGYMADLDLNKEIIKELEEPLKSGNEHKFILTITMQNHVPYNTKFENPVLFDSTLIENDKTLKSIDTFNTYVSGLEQTDKALENLLSTLSQRETPTMVVFYGDHLASINQDNRFYENIGFVIPEESSEAGSPAAIESDLKMHTVDGFIWKNYDDGTPSNNQHYKEIMNTKDFSLFSGEILREGNLPEPNYYKLLHNIDSTYNINSFTKTYAYINGSLYFPGDPLYKEVYNKLYAINGDISTGKMLIENGHQNKYLVTENLDYIEPFDTK